MLGDDRLAIMGGRFRLGFVVVVVVVVVGRHNKGTWLMTGSFSGLVEINCYCRCGLWLERMGEEEAFDAVFGGEDA